MKTQKSTIRRESILDAALELASSDHYRSITRDQIATRAGTATGNVNRLFGTIAELRRELVKHAIQHDNLKIIAQAITVNDPIVGTLDADIRRQAMDTFL
jgi:AcrR family transcriptional regulator